MRSGVSKPRVHFACMRTCECECVYACVYSTQTYKIHTCRFIRQTPIKLQTELRKEEMRIENILCDTKTKHVCMMMFRLLHETKKNVYFELIPMQWSIV